MGSFALLFTKISETAVSNYQSDDKTRWSEVGKIIDQVQQLEKRKRSALEKFKEATIKPLTGFPLLIAVLLTSFTIIKYLGGALKKMGWKNMLKSSAIMLITALVAGRVVNLIFNLF